MNFANQGDMFWLYVPISTGIFVFAIMIRYDIFMNTAYLYILTQYFI